MNAKTTKILVKLYEEETDKSVDQLPYTVEFDRLYIKFRHKTGMEMTRNEFWRTLTNLRKRGALPTKQLAKV